MHTSQYPKNKKYTYAWFCAPEVTFINHIRLMSIKLITFSAYINMVANVLRISQKQQAIKDTRLH